MTQTPDPYIPHPGDLVRVQSWGEGKAETVVAVGNRLLITADADGDEVAWTIASHDWVKVELPTPIPERWANIHANGYMTVSLKSRFECETHPMVSGAIEGNPRVAVLHVWSDADGVDHAEIERTQ